MPADSDPKTTGEYQKPRSGWLAKCGILLSSLSVRERRASDIEPNRLVMSTADRREKKRKRTSSPVSITRMPVKMLDRKYAGMREPEDKKITTRHNEARNVFNLAMDDTMALMDYLENYEQLQKKERQHAWDRGVMPERDPTTVMENEMRSMSQEEKARQKEHLSEWRASQIIRELREYEREMVFGNLPGEALPGEGTLDMGGQFLTNKARIEQRSKLYEIAKLVPKGGLLHLHFNAELHPERLLEEARNMPNMYIRSLQPLLSEKDLDETEMVFNVMDPNTESVDIFVESYQGRNWKQPDFRDKVWMKWSEFREKFAATDFCKQYAKSYDEQNDNAKEAKNGSVETCAEPGHVKLYPAENWIKRKMVLSADEAYDPKQTVNGIWARFNQATRCFKGLLNYEKVYKWYIGQAIDRLIEEKVMYAELRPMLLDKSIPKDNGEMGKLTNKEQMGIIRRAIAEKREQLEAKNRLHDFPYGLKIVYCTPRSIPPDMMLEEMKQCIELKLEFPELICGFDLVGAEDRPNSINFYQQHLVAFKETCKKLGLDIPFLFHAGETLLDTGGTDDPKNSNLFAAQILESKRIGHGFSLLKHPHLVEKFRRKVNKEGNVMDPGICIELCPISNELLHLCGNIKEHPYTELLAAGIPCTINSDNPSLFSNSMSHEFYQVMVGAPTMSIYSWKQLAYWSIEYSCLSKNDRADFKEKYTKMWNEFCSEVVTKYGGLMDGDKINIERADEAYNVKAYPIQRRP